MTPDAHPARGRRSHRAASAVVAFLLTVYPYGLPVLALRRWSGWRPSASDVAWLVACALFAALSLVHGVFDRNLLAVAFAFAVQASLRHASSKGTYDIRSSRLGLRAGALAIVALGVAQVLVGGAERATGFPWFGHPNIYAHAVLLIVAGLVGQANRRAGSAWLLLALAGIVVSGSRSGSIGLIVVLLVGTTLARYRRAAIVTLVTGGVAVSLAFLAAPGAPWAQRLAAPIEGLLVTAPTRNLLNASEHLDRPAAWNPSGVTVEALSSARGAPRPWRVTRTVAADWARPQQSVRIAPSHPYTLSAEFLATDARPGLIAWADGDESATVLRVALDESRARVLQASGVTDVEASAEPRNDGWVRLRVTFSIEGDQPVAVSVGPSPDVTSPRSNVATVVRALQLEQGREATPYQATTRIRTGMGEALARLPYWRAAVDGVRERPLVGHGYDSFADYFARSRANRTSDASAPRHPHAQLLASAFEGGVLGVIALLATFTALFHPAGAWGRAVLIGFATANMFDATFFIGALFLPAAALSALGMRDRRSASARIEA